MKNRDVSISICGVVLGIILGAGSLAFSKDASSFQASALPTVMQVPVHSAAASAVDTSAVTCAAVTDTVNQVTKVLTDMLPTSVIGNQDNQKNTTILAAVAQTTDPLIAQYCPPTPVAVPVSTSVKVNNHCNKFRTATNPARYNECKLRETLGRTYP